MTAIFFIVALMMVVSFFCSLSEASLYAAPITHIEALKLRGSRRGARLSLLRERIERPITAIVTLNTLATTMGAALAGDLVGQAFHRSYIAPFSLALTLLLLLFAEIVPKSLGVTHSRVLAPWLAWPIQALVWVLSPVVWMGDLLASVLKSRRTGGGPSEEEIVALAGLGVRCGTILPQEEHCIRHVLRLNNVTAREIMTPRPVLFTLRGDRVVGDMAAELQTLNFSRIPVVTEEGPDHITGIVMRRRIVNAFVEGRRELKIADLQQPALFVPATMRGHQLLHFFTERKSHLAIVVDEYGGTMGAVTLEDVIETMLGEKIVGELDPHPDLRQYARERAAERLKDSEQ